MRRTTTIVLIVVGLIVLLACNDHGPIDPNERGGVASGSNRSYPELARATPAASNTNTASTSTITTSNEATRTSSHGTTVLSVERIGVAECDDFLAKYEACVYGRVPEAARPQFELNISRLRDSWRKLAENPQTKASLAQACKTSMEQARTSMKAYGCEF